MQRKQFPPRHADPMDKHFGHKKEDDREEEESDEDDFDLVQVMQEMPIHKRRKVYAIKGLLNDFKNARAKFREELALLQIQHLKDAQCLHDIRKEIISGKREITEEEIALVKANDESRIEDIPSDDEKKASKKPSKSVRVVAPKEENKLEQAAESENGGIPNFWLTAMDHAETLASMITERDRHALTFLENITMEYVEGDPQKGVMLNFHFAPNEYFKNEVLTKTYCMCFDEDSGEVEIESLKATPVEWTSPEKNLTVVIKVKKQRHQKTNNIRIVKREEKCDSFFNLFTDPLEGEDDEDEDEEEEEEKAELHIEAGQLFMEEIIPKAAFYYTGKSVEQVAKALHTQLDFQGIDDDDDEEDEEEESEEEEEVVQPPAGRGGRGRGRDAHKNIGGGRGRGAH